MKKTVDYDEMFGLNQGKKDTQKKDKPANDKANAFERDWAERQAHQKRLEEFRKRPKRQEGFFERSDGFADIEFSKRPKTPYLWSRYNALKLLDNAVECIDGILVGVLFSVIIWLILKSFTAVVIAFEIGFLAGILLKFKVREQMTFKEAVRHALPPFLMTVAVILLMVIVLNTN